ncbi:HNH endonuclease [Psychrobacillus sp. INOP01]|uniref:HNH endonuclease n=1 Tax=Psychrobacillus sp. INOP01 TaxID=2829187 RepID=UPI001BA75831|nr:HNH endonuclease signature motif containing protein [Psychrobacillus sp. INOP01]QUG42775.1 HNH endonuclease [Psychrobacillus sp. INOP01]
MKTNLRRAIWKAHKKKCYYCDENVSIRELEIDHFIPKSTDKSLKEELLRELMLDSNFDFNGLKNLVPSHTSCNNARKGRYVPTAKSFSGVLVITERLLQKILEIKEELDLEEKYDENIGQIESYIEKGQASVEELYDYLNKDEANFEEVENIDHSSIRVSTKNVMIQCLLPRFPELHGSMLITFRSLRVRDCLITFNHSGIVNEIFQGIGSSPKDGYRGFIVYNDASKNSSVVQLGNNRFSLTLDEVSQLCRLIDKISPIYINTIKSIENVFKTQSFAYSTKGRFRLLKISRSLWREILEFAFEHDYENGTTEWHIFDGRASYLKIYCQTPGDSDRDYRTFIYPEAVDEGLWDKFISSDNEVWLCWEPSILIDNESDNTRVQNNIIWSAKYTYDWLLTRLIPTVIEYRREKDRSLLQRLFGQKKKLLSPFNEFNLDLAYNNALLITDYKDIDTLGKWVREVQVFFAIHSNHYLSVGTIEGVYKSIMLCLRNFKLNQGTFEYIKIKLDGNRSIESIIASVESKLNDLSNKNGINGSNMEYALRSLCALLHEGNYGEQDEAILVQKLTIFLEMLSQEYRFLSDLERVRDLWK